MENEEQEYHHRRKKAQKIIRNKKKLYIKNVTESTEEDKKHKTQGKCIKQKANLKKDINITLT
jgi:hypothetical protein